MNISLPDKIKKNEKLARIICASSKKKKYEKTSFYYDEKEKRYIVLTAQFIDSRNPCELSVNRVSTLQLYEAHSLGLSHQKEKQPKSTYHGFAETSAELCFDLGCKVEKDDIGGTKPYHANIVYPYAQTKEDNQEIAIKLAYHARLKKI